MGVVREGFYRFEIYNDGSLLFIYDLANAQAILDTVPIDDNYPLDSRNLDRAVRAGLIVLVELFEDDEIRCEVGVGKSLTSKEKKRANVPWLPTAHAHLWLPSGRLRLDSANSLALIPEEADEEGAEFSCEPGHYRVSIDRVSWGELDESDEYDGAGEIISLNRIGKEDFKENQNVLIVAEFPGSEDPYQVSPVPTVPVGTIENGIFHGHVYFAEDNSFWLNLTSPLAEKIPLYFGKYDLDEEGVQADFVRINVDELNMTVRACINGVTYFEMSKKELSQVGPEVATGLPQPFYVGFADIIRFSWSKNTRKIRKAERGRWLSATLEKD